MKMIKKNVILNNLYENRLLRNSREIEIFENSLAMLNPIFEEKDILQVCEVLDDKTSNPEIMFNIIHLIETKSSEMAFLYTINSVVNIRYKSPDWAKIIIYRCLNDSFSREMLKVVSLKLDKDTRESFYDFLVIIKNEDYDKFSNYIDYIIL